MVIIEDVRAYFEAFGKKFRDSPALRSVRLDLRVLTGGRGEDGFPAGEAYELKLNGPGHRT